MITVQQLMTRIQDRKESIVSGLASQEGNEIYRTQGDYRTIEWILGLPEQMEAEQAMETERDNYAEDV